MLRTKKNKFIVITLILISNCNQIGQCQIQITNQSLSVSNTEDKVLLYGFHVGDEIILNLEMLKGKNLKSFSFSDRNGNQLYSDYKLSEFKDVKIQIPSTDIYRLSFSNSALLTRVCRLNIKRIPSSPETENYNTAIKWRTIKDTVDYIRKEEYVIRDEFKSVSIIPPSKFYLNSTSNEYWKGGNSKTSVQVKLPGKTIQWYYQFSSSRNEEEINKVQSQYNLIGKIASVLTSDITGGVEEITNAIVSALVPPPGANICDVYLLYGNNVNLFNSNDQFTFIREGTRQNFNSGIVKVEPNEFIDWLGVPISLGIKNNDDMNGIHVVLEVVAIQHFYETAFKEIPDKKVVERKEMYCIGFGE